MRVLTHSEGRAAGQSLLSHAGSPRNRPTHRTLGCCVVGSALTCIAIVCSQDAMSWWATILTTGQVLAMFGISRDKRAAWAFGLGLQAPWATYDVLTGQYPFLITSVLVSIAQIGALRRLAQQAGAPLPMPGTPAGLLRHDDEATNN